uniref:Uncharacterized protein n=1 Tax=Anguilla anguilla TaxID=7936 RepID=A0A0E9RIY9_ANGAN
MRERTRKIVYTNRERGSIYNTDFNESWSSDLTPFGQQPCAIT